MSRNINIDISLHALEETINTCDEIITSLEGSEGLHAFTEATQIIESDFDGKYANALSNSVLEAKMNYLDSLSNVSAIKMVLKEYKNFLQNGTNNRLTNNANHIKIDMEQIYTQIRNLEYAIETDGNLKKTLTNSAEFDVWYVTYKKSLDDGIFKSYETDENGNMTEAGILAHLKDQNKEKIFRANESSLSNLNATIAGGLVATSSIVTKLEVISGVISGELNDLSAIWNVFDFNKIDMHNYLVAKYEMTNGGFMLNNDKTGASDQLKSDFELALLAMLNGDSTDINTILNKIVSELDGEDEEGVLKDLYGISSNLINYLNLLLVNARRSDEDNILGLTDKELYEYYKKVYAVNAILEKAYDYTLGTHSESISNTIQDIYTYKPNDITSIEIGSDGTITIKGNDGSSLEIIPGINLDTEIYDTLMEKTNAEGALAWKEDIANNNTWISVIIISAISAGLPEVYAPIKSGVSFINLVISTKEVWEDYEETREEFICRAFNLSMNGDGEYFLDAKGFLVICEFTMIVNEGKTAADIQKWENGLITALKDPEAAQDWFKADSGVPNPKKPGKEYSNQALIANIAEDIEDQFGME